MSGTEDALTIEQLSVTYNKTAALWDINCSIPSGHLVGVIGPNGAGKSSFLKGALGLTPKTSGSIRFFGKKLSKSRQRVAYVPQRSSVDWDFPITALDLVLMGRYGRLGFIKWVTKKDREAADDALEMVGMTSFAKRQISQLSGGQQQRLFIARALSQEADLYLMDEPFAGVDMATEKELIELFKKLRSLGKTLIIVHHDLNTAKRYFDWLVILNTCLIASGPTTDVFTDSNISRAYSHTTFLLTEAAKLSQEKTSGKI
jgi:manganese/zinc/iron transport system ATP- binding protein